MPDTKVTLDQIVSLSKRRGFIFQSSEIYGGLGACWDYGPLGVELKQNIKNCWWDFMVRSREDVVGIDGSILMHPEVWVASGHVAGFHDPLVDCRESKNRYRFDQMLAYRHPSRHDLPLFAFMEDNPSPAEAKIKKMAKGAGLEEFEVIPLPNIAEEDQARETTKNTSHFQTIYLQNCFVFYPCMYIFQHHDVNSENACINLLSDLFFFDLTLKLCTKPYHAGYLQASRYLDI